MWRYVTMDWNPLRAATVSSLREPMSTLYNFLLVKKNLGYNLLMSSGKIVKRVERAFRAVFFCFVFIIIEAKRN